MDFLNDACMALTTDEETLLTTLIATRQTLAEQLAKASSRQHGKRKAEWLDLDKRYQAVKAEISELEAKRDRATSSAVNKVQLTRR